MVLACSRSLTHVVSLTLPDTVTLTLPILLLLQATKLSAAAAATKVQLSFSSTALKSQQALDKELQARLAKLQAEEAQHKQAVAEKHKQLRQLQEQQAAADQQLAAAQQAADEGCGGASHTAAAAATAASGRRGKRAGAGTTQNEGPSKELQALQQQQLAAETELAELQGVHSAAATKATRAAAAVAGLQASLEEVETAAAKSTQQLQEAAAARQQAAAGVDAGRAAVQDAEQAWKDAHMQQRTLQVRQTCALSGLLGGLVSQPASTARHQAHLCSHFCWRLIHHGACCAPAWGAPTMIWFLPVLLPRRSSFSRHRQSSSSCSATHSTHHPQWPPTPPLLAAGPRTIQQCSS